MNEKKIIKIILDECKSVEERCKGYRQELVEVIADMVTAERQHRVQGTNIQQKIIDKCNAAGRFLAEKRGQAKTAKGVSDEAHPRRV
jgi:hypothetical protein